MPSVDTSRSSGRGGVARGAAALLNRVIPHRRRGGTGVVNHRNPWLHLGCLGLIAALMGAGCADVAPVPGGTSVASLVVDGVQLGGKSCDTPDNTDALVARVLELVNKERTQRGLGALTLNPTLSKMAEDYACEMIEGNFFDHVNPVTNMGPGQRAVEHGYVFLAMGENLAGGQSTPEQVMAEWMASTAGHRENILAAQWREVGIAVRTGGQFGVYWVQEFGNPP